MKFVRYVQIITKLNLKIKGDIIWQKAKAETKAVAAAKRAERKGVILRAGKISFE